MNAFSNFQQFCDSPIECIVNGTIEKWKIDWENEEPTALSRKLGDEQSETLFYTTSDFMFDPFIKVYFMRDLEKGFKERIHVFFNQNIQEISGDITRNAQAGYYDDWDLRTSYYSTVDGATQRFAVGTKLEGKFYAPHQDITPVIIHRKALDKLEITLLDKVLCFNIQNPQGSALVGEHSLSGVTFYVELHHETDAPTLEATAVLYKQTGQSRKQNIGQILVFKTQ